MALVAVAVAATFALAQAEATDTDLDRASGGRRVALGSLTSRARPANVALETYVARVLAGEAEPNAPDGELEALAIAIRTFAIFNAGRHRADGFDLCDTTHCQVPRTATPATRRAALATAGRILTYRGRTAEIFYSASCGGHSEDASAVWPAADLPYLRSVPDDVHEHDEPWTLRLTVQQIQQALGRGFSGRLRAVAVDARNDSGRVARVALSGLRPATIAGTQLRMLLGPRVFKSTAFSVSVAGDTVTFTGTGYGHGVGLCVIGAGRRALRGEPVEAILAHYFPGLDLTRLDGSPDPATAAAPAPAAEPVSSAVASPAPGGRVTVHAPARGAVDPVEFERMARRAHETLSERLGVSGAPLTIDLYETIEAFRAATGKPWWVSAAVRGTAIALTPAELLAQREGVDTVLRSAVAEALIAPALTGRPVWVRVGAARYFSRTEPPSPPRTRVACPSDAELTSAVSVTAQRAADARAEACFAAAYARTQDWRAVR